MPAFLTPQPGLNSGFMIAQVTAAALAAENRAMATPRSVDSLPTSANQEDHVSMATFAARRLHAMLDNTAHIVAIELLAAVPSIIYGMFGLFIFAPLFAEYGQPALQSTLGQMPIIAPLFGGAMNGIGILAAGIILAFMILPFIAAVMRDVFEIVPPVLRESAYGLGCTTWEVVRNIVLPYTQKGVIGGVMLGLGRALGETMAVTFVIGNSQRITGSLFSPGSSIASTLANEFGEAADLHLSTLFALGFLLFRPQGLFGDKIIERI